MFVGVLSQMLGEENSILLAGRHGVILLFGCQHTRLTCVFAVFEVPIIMIRDMASHNEHVIVQAVI
jgi:mRNA-degrading endonuclease HigB of HigAB toxin-antitoxin module